MIEYNKAKHGNIVDVILKDILKDVRYIIANNSYFEDGFLFDRKQYDNIEDLENKITEIIMQGCFSWYCHEHNRFKKEFKKYGVEPPNAFIEQVNNNE